MRNELPFAILSDEYTGLSLFPVVMEDDTDMDKSVAVRYLPDDEAWVQSAAKALNHAYFLAVDSQRLVYRVGIAADWPDKEMGRLVPGHAPANELELTVDGRTFHVQSC